MQPGLKSCRLHLLQDCYLDAPRERFMQAVDLLRFFEFRTECEMNMHMKRVRQHSYRE